jgi:hypothetical protein
MGKRGDVVYNTLRVWGKGGERERVTCRPGAGRCRYADSINNNNKNNVYNNNKKKNEYK